MLSSCDSTSPTSSSNPTQIQVCEAWSPPARCDSSSQVKTRINLSTTNLSTDMDPTKFIEVEKQTVQASTDSEPQSVLRITLNGPALVFTIVTLSISVHLLHPYILSTILALAPLPFVIRNDYRAFLSLGPGGTPSTFPGYLKISFLRLFALRDPFVAPTLDDTHNISPRHGLFHGSLSLLQKRSGPRPRVEGIAPQRQRNQIGSTAVYLAFRRACQGLAAFHPALVQTAPSCFEKHGLALFAKQPINATCRGEICHVHDSDHSLHLNLHPEDAAVVLERGWGQRHPLAKGGFMAAYVPREFVMVYSPRDEEELEAVLRIVEAAAWWVTGRKLDMTSLGRKPESENRVAN